MRTDRGAADALGLALIAPAAIALALVILFVSRGVDGRATAQNAAEAAAQAAARERSLPAATAAADRVGAAMLVDVDTCAAARVDTGVDGGVGFVPGAVVRVTVSCTATSRGLELAGGNESVSTATAYAVIDTFRSVDR
ncbi:MAG: pilus assembly protein [Actinomycetota bacterium]